MDEEERAELERVSSERHLRIDVPESASRQVSAEPAAGAKLETKSEAGETRAHDALQGLSDAEYTEALAKHGENYVARPEISFFAVFVEEVTEPLILLLIVVAILFGVWAEFGEAITAIVVIALCIGLELFTEFKAKRAVNRLNAAAYEQLVTVTRGGRTQRVAPRSLVPGDVVTVQGGDPVPADGRLLQAVSLQTVEAALTGENGPVHKSCSPNEKHGMLWKGTVVAQGVGTFVVTATAANTRTGNLLKKIKQIRVPRSPLQVLLKSLALKLTLLAAAIVCVVIAIGFGRGLNYRTVILSGLALAFAIIPEELPILIKVVLAIGSVQLSKVNLLVRRLKTAEALGTITTVLSDKTGTLTHAELNLALLAVPGQHALFLNDDLTPRDACWPGHTLPAAASSSSSAAAPAASAAPDSAVSSLSSSSSTSGSTSLYGERIWTGGSLDEAAAAMGISDSDAVSAAAASEASACLRLHDEMCVWRPLVDTWLLSSAGLEALLSRPQLLRQEQLRVQRKQQKVANSTCPDRHVIGDRFDRSMVEFLLGLRDPSLETVNRIARAALERRRREQQGQATGGDEEEDDNEHADFGPHARTLLDAVVRARTETCERMLQFDSWRKRSSCLRALPSGGHRLYTRGAAQSLLKGGSGAGVGGKSGGTGADAPAAVCTHVLLPPAAGSSAGAEPTRVLMTEQYRQSLLAALDGMSAAGLRVITFAYRDLPETKRLALNASQLESELTFVGALAFADRVRSGVPRAIAELQRAGITVKMVTGDHPLAAKAIARETGILPDVDDSAAADARTSVEGAAVDELQLDPSELALFDTDPSGRAPKVVPVHGLAEPDPSVATPTAVLAMRRAMIDLADKWVQQENNSGGGGKGKSPRSPKPERKSLAIAVAQEKEAEQKAVLRRLLEARVFSRLNPDHKLRLVLAHQRNGERVLATGDGFNDGAALRAADVGVAMGEGGTDTARQAAGLVLTDDAFETVVVAVREGRKMLDNLVKAIRFYLACKFALVLLFLVSIISEDSMPLAPVHVVLIEAFMDLGASAAYTADPADEDVMTRGPSSPEFTWLTSKGASSRSGGRCSRLCSTLRSFAASFWGEVLGLGLVMFANVCVVFFVGQSLYSDEYWPEGASRMERDQQAQTMTVIAWLIGHVLLGNSMRSLRQPLGFVKPVLSNPFMIVWTCVTVLVTLCITLIPRLRSWLELSDMSSRGMQFGPVPGVNATGADGALLQPFATGSVSRKWGWALAFGVPCVMFLFLEAVKWLRMGCRCLEKPTSAAAEVPALTQTVSALERAISRVLLPVPVAGSSSEFGSGSAAEDVETVGDVTFHC